MYKLLRNLSFKKLFCKRYYSFNPFNLDYLNFFLISGSYLFIRSILLCYTTQFSSKNVTSSGTSSDDLRDLVPFAQFQKREKHPWRSVNFSKVANSKSNTPLWVFLAFFKLYKWNTIAQDITLKR